MIQRILTALVLIPLVLLLILRAPVWLLAIVAAIVALLAIREFLELTKHYGVEPSPICTYIFVGIFFAALSNPARNGRWAPLFMAIDAGLFAGLAPFVFVVTGLRRDNLKSIYSSSAASVFAFVYIAVPMGLLVALRTEIGGDFSVITLMLVVWSGDIFAYFAGKAFGRHKMSPRISPAKTWEGAAASLIASTVVGILFYRYSAHATPWLVRFHLLQPGTNTWGGGGVAVWRVVFDLISVNFAAQLGDLVESAIKRGADVKDSGAILPGHGGMLDRIDAMLFAVPVFWLWLLYAHTH